jgi:hypothetical protein
MKTREAFSRTYAWLERSSLETAKAFGEYDLAWTSDGSTNRLRNALIFIQGNCAGDLDRLSELTIQILLDILALRQTATPTGTAVLNLLQLDICVTVMGTAHGQKHLQMIFDWTIYSICDVYPYELENLFEYSRVVDLFNRATPSVYADFGREIGLEWLKFFYNYVFKVGGLKEPALLLAPFAVSLLNDLLPAADAIEPATRVAEWSIRNRYAGRTPLVSKLKQVFDQAEPGSDRHFFLGLSFALLVGRDSGINTQAVARMLLQSYQGTIPPNWKIQLLQAALVPGPIEMGPDLDEIVETIQHYRAETLEMALGSFAIEYEFERSFTLISAIVLALLKSGQTNPADNLIGAWKGLPINSAREDVLFLVPNAEGGTLYSRQGGIYVVDNGNDSFVDLINAINHFHGTNIVLDDDDSLAPHIPRRLGLPEHPVESSNSYLIAMRQQFQLIQARSFLEEARRADVRALRLLPGLPCPIQPLMIADLGFSWPIASTMSLPREDRRCARALIWTEGTLIGERQAGWIAEVLRAQTEVTIASGSADRFRAEFSSAAYDTIWITAHGEFDHVDPHRSRLALCDGPEMTFEDLKSIQIPELDRRLLVLDVCDSAAVPVYGGLSEFGFGPMLTSVNQAVISYRWPVEQLPSALFNILLAIGLRSKSFYEAYEFSIATLILGKNRTIEVLSVALGHDHELVGLLRDNESIRWNTLAFWGSAVFLE